MAAVSVSSLLGRWVLGGGDFESDRERLWQNVAMRTSEGDDYREDWRRYRRIRNVFWLTLLSLIPSAAVIYWLASNSVISPALLDLLIMLCLTPSLVASLKFGSCACPTFG